MNYRATKNNVIVERIAAEKVTESGLILKSSAEPDKAKILSVGPDATNDVSVGEIALVNWNKATKIEDETYILNVNEIVMVYG